MGVISRLVNWIKEDTTVGGAPGRELSRRLREEAPPADRTSDQATNIELDTAAVALHTAIDVDTKAGVDVKQPMAKLRQAAADTKVALDDAVRWFSEPGVTVRVARAAEHAERHTTTLTKKIDVAQHLISKKVMMWAEVLMVAVEVFFWIQLFSSDVDRRESHFGMKWLGVYALALFIPTLSLLASRFAGPALQRWWRYPSEDRDERRVQHLAGVLSIVAVGGSALATGALVNWRYSSGTASNAFALLPPAVWMTLLFVGIILLDTFLRAISRSEQQETNDTRDAAVAADQAEQKRIEDRVVATKATWGNAGDELRLVINKGLNKVEQIVLTAERLILEARSTNAGDLTRPAALDAVLATGAAIRWHVDVNLLTIELRNLAAAVAVSEEYAPPTVHAGEQALKESTGMTAAHIADLDRRLAALRAQEPETSEVDAAEGSDAAESGNAIEWDKLTQDINADDEPLVSHVNGTG